MKLFENGVGRPSNETIRKRRIFIASIVAMVALILTVGGVLLTNSFNSNELQGAAAKKLTLKCPTRQYTISEFKCTTNLSGVKISVGGANSLASGYTSSFVTTANDKSKSIKYTNKLFTNYKNLIKKEKYFGKYIPVTIKASKKGYKTVTKKVKIHKEYLIGSCSGKEGQITCTAYKPGVKITVDKAEFLEAGNKSSIISPNDAHYGRSSDFENYNVEFTYKDELFTKNKKLIKKDKDGREYIPVNTTIYYKDYGTIKKAYNVYKPTRVSLSCPASAYVNKEFKCTTNLSGVKISMGGAKALASGYTASFVTTAYDKSKSMKYTDKLFTNYKNLVKKSNDGRYYINIKVTASKKGLKSATKYIKIYKLQ